MSKQWFKNGKRLLIDGVRCLSDECPCVEEKEPVPAVVSKVRRVYQGWNPYNTVVTYWYSTPFTADNEELGQKIGWLNYDKTSDWTIPEQEPGYFPYTELVDRGNDVFDDESEWCIVDPVLRTGYEIDSGMGILGENYFYRYGYIIDRAVIINNSNIERKYKITVTTNKHEWHVYRGLNHPTSTQEDYNLDPLVVERTIPAFGEINMPGMVIGSIEVPDTPSNIGVYIPGDPWGFSGYFEHHSVVLTHGVSVMEIPNE